MTDPSQAPTTMKEVQQELERLSKELDKESDKKLGEAKTKYWLQQFAKELQGKRNKYKGSSKGSGEAVGTGERGWRLGRDREEMRV